MANKKARDYQALSAELDEVMARLQDPEVGIDEAVEFYKRGQELVGELEKYLKTAKNTVQKLKVKYNE